MNEITKYQFKMPIGNDLDSLTKFCTVMANCPFYQKMGPGGVMAIYLTAQELNLPFMACLNGGMYTFNGLVTLSAQLMNMMIVNAGHRADVQVLNEEMCKIKFVRGDREKGSGDTFEYTFTMQDAHKAQLLNKKNWQTNPKDMLFARCLSGGARKFMPDVLMNCYVQGEIVDSEVEVKDVEVKNNFIPNSDNTCISEPQAEELKMLMQKCSPETIKAIRIRFEELKIPGVEKLPSHMFQNVHEYISKNVNSAIEMKENAHA